PQLNDLVRDRVELAGRRSAVGEPLYPYELTTSVAFRGPLHADEVLVVLPDQQATAVEAVHTAGRSVLARQRNRQHLDVQLEIATDLLQYTGGVELGGLRGVGEVVVRPGHGDG